MASVTWQLPDLGWCPPTRIVRTFTGKRIPDGETTRGVNQMFNLRNRSFLKEIDFQPRELRYLLQLSEAVKIAKYAGTETKRLDGK